MKNQVTSIEQSKRLIEMGVPADKASMVWEWLSDVVDETNYGLKIWRGGRMDKILAYQEFPESFIPAFTVADLLAVLPKKIMTNGGKVHILHIEACSSTSPCWCLYWGDEATQVGQQERISFLHLLEDAIEWLCLNGYKLNL